MGRFLNPGIESFLRYTKSLTYVDKSGIIEETNKLIGTDKSFICMVRPRRFGKSLAAYMLNAYYCKGQDTHEVFAKYEISKKASYETYLNKYDVIYIDFQSVYSELKGMNYIGESVNILEYLHRNLVAELVAEFGENAKTEYISFPASMNQVSRMLNRNFVVIIDEWDCLFREEKENEELQREYVNFLRSLFKGAVADNAISLAYITGILPIVKYGTQSALNNFDEYSMIDAAQFCQYMGLTDTEVDGLCKEYGMDMGEMSSWYDGYQSGDCGHVFNPNSVAAAIRRKRFDNYWTTTDTYEVLRDYISINFDGLKDAVIHMLAGGKEKVNTLKFKNRMDGLSSKDDALTILIHLGYLAYDMQDGTVRIPNEEVRVEFANAVEDTKWTEVIKVLQKSDKLLEYLWARNNEKVAQTIDFMHETECSILQYNDENTLANILSMAFFTARQHYTFHRELQAGKGFADLVLLPRLYTKQPPIILELKYDKAAGAAIEQIKAKHYPTCLTQFDLQRFGTCLLAGINYDPATKKHEAQIEEWVIERK
ncbi:MAG TPA: AAA family ATPase [Paludibacteraceae bacterium]|nr:AAA family ATPase [Paludibacteraceae bacterium]